MDFLSAHLALIEQGIRQLPFPVKPANLYDPCRYILTLGGKRLRPALTLMAHTLFDADNKKALPAALCVELFHNFSLIHDDIMDKAPLRRGQPTVHTKWNDTVGILSGDVMLVNTYKLLSDHYNGEPLKKLLKIYTTTAIEVCEGQQMDMDFESREDVTTEEYIGMISLKTSVLLGCALEMGAITAGASENDARHLYDFGKNLGIAFQLRDDYLDAFGDPAKTGKQPGGDILSGKKTFLIIEAAQVASEADSKKLYDTLAGKGQNKVKECLEILDHYDTRNRVQQEVGRYQQVAMEHLQKVKADRQQKEPFYQLAEFLLNREN
jgi:geranylgeranyl diphosphate synthase type II